MDDDERSEFFAFLILLVIKVLERGGGSLKVSSKCLISGAGNID